MRDYKDTYTERKSRIKVLPILLLIVILLFVAGIFLSWNRWERKAPVVRMNQELKALGRNPSISLFVQDQESGLKRLTVTLKQKDQVVPLIDEEYSSPSLKEVKKLGDRAGKTVDLGQLIAIKHKIQEGPATIEISAMDNSFGHFFRGNRTEAQHNFVFDLYPPRLEVLSGQHYIEQGGAGCVVYRVSSDAETSGVQV